MNIEKAKEGSTLTISVSGRVDSMTAPDFEKEVDAVADDVKELVFDFKNLEYTSSAGLRVVFKAQKMMDKKGTLIVKNANETIKEIFEITGFSSIINME